jgi:hypothetical protein
MYVAKSLSIFIGLIHVNRFVEGGVLEGATYTGPSPFQIGNPVCVIQTPAECQALATKLGRKYKYVKPAWGGAFRGCYQHPLDRGQDAVEFHWTPGGSEERNGSTLPPSSVLDYNYARVWCGETDPQIEKLTYSFPPTTTDRTIHGICVKGAASNGVSVYSDKADLTYSYVPSYVEGRTPLWSGSSAKGGGGFCEEGAFMRARMSYNDLGMTVSVEAMSLSSDSPVTLCFFIEDVDVRDGRTGGWENLEGFTFVSNYKNGLWEGAKIYCGEMKRSDATYPPTSSPTMSLTTISPTAVPTAIAKTTSICPKDIRLVKEVGVTEFPLARGDDDTSVVNIISQDKSTVTVELNQAWDGSIDKFFYEYKVDAFKTQCAEEDEVKSGVAIDTITLQCNMMSPYANLYICLQDTNGNLLDTGDTASVPKCCHSDAPEDTPTVCYQLEIACETECGTGEEFSQRRRNLRSK